MRNHLVRVVVVGLLVTPPAAGLAIGCSSDTDGSSAAGGPTAGTASTGSLTTGTAGTAGTSSTGSGGAGGAGSGTASTGTTMTGTGGVGEVGCQGHVYECGDTIDNDGDGLIDSADDQCLGPCDNTENGLIGGIPGDSGPACTVDCYFDQDSGSGNDDCHWNHQCDPHEVAPDFYPESVNGNACEYDPNANTSGTSATCDEMYAMQTNTCMTICGPLTPNGCDCFGCCELPAGGGNYVWLGSEDGAGEGKCTMPDVADPTKCEPCLPVAACLNGCGTCELCIGKTELPPECFPDGGATTGSGAGGGGPAPQCPDGITPCGLPGQSPCAAGFYCITGCCVPAPP